MTGMCSQEWCTHSAHWPQIEAVNQAKAEARAYMDALARAEAAEEQLARVTAERDAADLALSSLVRVFVATHGLSWLNARRFAPNDARVAFVTELGPIRTAVDSWQRQRAAAAPTAGKEAGGD